MLNSQQIRNSLIIFTAFLLLSYAFSLHIHPYRAFCNDLLVILGLVLVVAYWACVPKIALRVPKIVIVPLVFIVVIAAQTWNQFILYPADMVFPVIYFICLAIAFTVGSTISKHENGLSILSSSFACCFIASGILSVIFQHIQLLNLKLMPWVVSLDWTSPLRPFANFAQPNTLALSLCFALASVWYLFSLARMKPVYAAGLTVLLLWGLALTQSRIAWIILPLFALFLFLETRKGERRIQITLLMFLILFAGFVIAAPFFLHMAGGVAASVEDRAGQTGVRLVLWQQALAMSEAHPWFGVGWFQFGVHQVLTATDFKPTEYSDMAHNLLLNLAAEIGWPLTVLFTAGALYWIYQCCVRRWENAQVRYISMIFIAIGVHSMVEFPLWYAFILIPTGILAGALHTEQLGWEEIPTGRGWLAGFCAISLMVMFMVSLDYRRAASGFSSIALIQLGDNRYLGGIQKPEYTLFPQYFDYFHIIEIQPKPNMPVKDLNFLERISLRFAFAPVLDRLAIAYSNNGRPQEALQVLTIIQRLQNSGYTDIYSSWREYAEKNPDRYGEIYKRMPVPEIPATGKN